MEQNILVSLPFLPPPIRYTTLVKEQVAVQIEPLIINRARRFRGAVIMHQLC